MSVLHDVRQDLREFLARDERGELNPDQRRALIDATIRDLQDFEVQLSNALCVLANAPEQSAHDGKRVGSYSVSSGDNAAVAACAGGVWYPGTTSKDNPTGTHHQPDTTARINPPATENPGGYPFGNGK